MSFNFESQDIITRLSIKIDDYFTFQFLQKNYLLVEEFIDTYPVYSFFGFYIIHLLLLTFFIPASLVAFITAGFFFHPILAIFFCTFNTVLGGLVNFFTITKTDRLGKKETTKMGKKMVNGLTTKKMVVSEQ